MCDFPSLTLRVSKRARSSPQSASIKSNQVAFFLASTPIRYLPKSRETVKLILFTVRKRWSDSMKGLMVPLLFFVTTGMVVGQQSPPPGSFDPGNSGCSPATG